MRLIVKISLMIAVIAATYGSAVAGTVTVTKQTHSLEGLNGVTANQTSNSITYTLDAAYAVGDTITFTFTSNALVATPFPSQLNVPAVDSATPANAIAGLGLGLLSSSASSVTYRVTSLSQPDDTSGDGGTPYTDRTTIGAQVTLGSIDYTSASVSAGAVTVTVSSQTNVGGILDSTGTLTATIAEAKTQFGTATISTKFDNVIDVSAVRKLFTSGSSDTLTWSVTTPDTTGWFNMATINPSNNGTVVKLFGEVGKMNGLDVADFTSSAGTLSFDEPSSTLTVSFDGQESSATITFTPPTGAAAVVLETQSFTLDIVNNYTSAAAVAASKTIVASMAAGEWILNGLTCIIPYMPYSATASQIIYVSNLGQQSGDIIVEAIDDADNLYQLGVIGTASAGTVTKITNFINDALLSNGFTDGKLALKIVVNAPSEDVYVYASYNAGGVRGYVEVDYLNK